MWTTVVLRECGKHVSSAYSLTLRPKNVHVYADCSHLHNTSSILCVLCSYITCSKREADYSYTVLQAVWKPAGVCACVDSITESTGSEQRQLEDTVMLLYMYIVQDSCTSLSGTDTTIKNIGTHIHKFHHPLVAQHFYIYNTQRLHVSAIYPGHQEVTRLLDLCSLYTIHPGHLQGVCSTCEAYMVTRTDVQETCNSQRMARIYGRNM
jgi:hypothetical protein